MIYTLGKSRRLAAIATDVLLVGVLIANVLTRADGPLSRVVSFAVPVVLVWAVVTLHYPREVELDDGAITLRAYGRAHRFAWSSIERLHVRRFLVRDRVLLRITPAPPWRGRYWLMHSFERFPELVAELERRASHRET